MRRWETLTALAAVVLASIGSIPAVPFRYALTGAAVVSILLVGGSRLYVALRSGPKTPAAFDAAQRAREIRAKRDRRN